MNFVIELSKNKDEFNAILIIMNRLTKMHHYIFCITKKEKRTRKKTIRLLINRV